MYMCPSRILSEKEVKGNIRQLEIHSRTMKMILKRSREIENSAFNVLDHSE